MPEPDPLPAIKTPWGPAPPPSGASAGGVPPIPIPDHTLLRRIGKGSYGEVWLARNALGVYRAVKIIDRRAFDDDRPFEREFAGMQRFEPVSRSHESQLNILQVGRGPDCFYYVMELADDMSGAYASGGTSAGGTSSTSPHSSSQSQMGTRGTRPSDSRGGSLNPDTYTPRNLRSELLLRGRLPVDDCLRLGLALTTALENLHRHGLVHRDIKPSNIVFVNGIPKLADIGLVALAEATMSFVGTEGYLPPEGPGSVRADLFSLGKVLYEISTGRDRQQFPELPTGITELPDRAALAEFNEVLLRACAPEVKQRYESAAEMHADLALLQSGKSVARMRAVERRLKFVARAGALVTGIALLAGAAFLYQQVQTREARRLASANRQLAEEKTQLAADQSRLLNENRARLVRLDVANGNRYMDAGDLGQAMLWFGQALQQTTNDPARAEMHRFRMANLLAMHPKLVAVLRLNTGPNVFEQFDQSPFVVAPEGRRVLARTGSGLELWDLTLPPRRVLEVPRGGDWEAFDLTPDGRRFYVRNLEERAQIWAVSPDGKAHMTEAKSVPLQSAFFASSGKRLVGVTTNRALLCFDTESGEPDGPPIELGNYLELDHSRRGDWVGVLYSNQTTRVLDVLNRRLLEGPSVGKEWISVTPILAGRGLLGYATSDRDSPAKFQLWDLATGQAVGAPITHRKAIGQWSCNSEMTQLASSSIDQTARVWSLITGDPLSPVLVHPTGVRRIVLSADGTRAATTAMDGVVRIWNASTGRLAAPPLFHGGGTSFLQFGPDDAQLLVADSSGLLRVWDLTTPESMRTSLGFDRNPQHLAISPDGEVLAVSISGQTTLWRLRDLARLGSIPTMPSVGRPGPMRMSFSSDSRYLAIVDHTDGARVWDAQTGEPAGPKLAHGTNDVVAASFSPDARELATAGHEDAMVRFWDWRKGLETRTPLVFTNRPMRMTWSPLHNRLLVWGEKGLGGIAALWDLDKRTLLAEPFWCNGSYEFSRDGTRIAVADPFTNVRLLDGVTGQPVCAPLQHASWIWGLAFSPDNKRLLTGSHDRTAVIWNAADGKKLLTLSGADEPVTDVAFLKDGAIVAAWTESGRARLWGAVDGDPLTPWVETGAKNGPRACHPERLLLAAGDGREVNLNEFVSPSASPDMLIRLAGLVAGREPADNFTGTSIPAEAIIKAHDQLRREYPGSFQVPTAVLTRWHEHEALERPSLARLESSLYHLERLSQLEPTNSALRDKRARLADLRIPARAPGTSARLLDLTGCYTEAFGTMPTTEFAELPRGVQRLGGIEFDLRGLILLRHTDTPPGSQPVGDRVSYLRVQQRCARLHFLQGLSSSAPEGVEVARWVMHYADGSQRVWPVRYAEHLREWMVPDSKPKEASRATLAWQRRGESTPHNATLCLYVASWENPQPDVEVTHLEFQMGDSAPQPFVLAITAE